MRSGRGAAAVADRPTPVRDSAGNRLDRDGRGPSVRRPLDTSGFLLSGPSTTSRPHRRCAYLHSLALAQRMVGKSDKSLEIVRTTVSHAEAIVVNAKKTLPQRR